MPVYKCKCGAKYKLPESAAGRRVRCKKCDHSFTVPKAEPEIVPLTLAPLEDTGTYAPQFQPSPDGHIPSPAPTPAEPRAAKGYMQNVLWTFLFLSKPSNLATFLVLWFLFFVAPFFFMIVSIFLSLWFAAFSFEVILNSAAGDDDIPDVGYSGDMSNEFLLPVFKWFMSWLFVMMPLVVYLIVNVVNGSISPQIMGPILFGGAGALLQMGSDPYIPALVIFGLVCWPISILCMTLGGIGSLIRIDLMALTVIRSLHGYVFTLCFLGCAIGIEWAIGSALANSGTGAGGSFSDKIIGNLARAGVNLYIDIVVLRIIGLYYRHFKNKFAWDWG